MFRQVLILLAFVSLALAPMTAAAHAAAPAPAPVMAEMEHGPGHAADAGTACDHAQGGAADAAVCAWLCVAAAAIAPDAIEATAMALRRAAGVPVPAETARGLVPPLDDRPPRARLL